MPMLMPVEQVIDTLQREVQRLLDEQARRLTTQEQRITALTDEKHALETRIAELLAQGTTLIADKCQLREACASLYEQERLWVQEKQSLEARITELLTQNTALAEEQCMLGDMLHEAHQEQTTHEWQAEVLTLLRALLRAVRGEAV